MSEAPKALESLGVPDPTYDPWAGDSILGTGQPSPAPIAGNEGVVPVPPTGQPELISKTYDFGEGPVTFEATDVDDLMSQVTIYQNQRFEKTLFDEDSAKQFNPDIEPNYYEPAPEPSADQISAAWLLFERNPLEGLKKFNEYLYGESWESHQQRIHNATELRNYIYGGAVGDDFVNRHVQLDEQGYIIGGDYWPTPENSFKIRRYMEVKRLDPTPENYDHALAKLNSIHALAPMPEIEQEEFEEEAPRKVSSGLSGRDSSYASKGQNQQLTAEEIKRRAMTAPIEELERAIRENRLVNI